MRADQRVEALEHVLEHRPAAERALHADGHDQAVLDQPVVESSVDVVGTAHVIRPCSTSSIEALLAEMRSLEIISAADSESR